MNFKAFLLFVLIPFSFWACIQQHDSPATSVRQYQSEKLNFNIKNRLSKSSTKLKQPFNPFSNIEQNS